MISTYAQVKTRALALLDDPNQGTFSDSIMLEALGEAVDALQQAFAFYQIKRTKVIATYTLPTGTTSLSPATAGITDLATMIELRERLAGSTDRYQHVWEVDDLTQRTQVDTLSEWEWRGDSFYFIGATTSRDLQIIYWSSTEQPTDFTGSTGTDGVKTFLSKYTAGAAGPRKGYNELSAMYMKQAVGSRYDDGIIGGELFRVCQPKVREDQRVQVAPKPYSVIRRRAIRQVPYVAAQQPAGAGMGAPVQFSTANGTITGTIDGVNATFYLSYPVTTLVVYRNGLLMTQPTDVVWGSNQIVFQSGQIPQPASGGSPADVITAEGWT